MAAGEIKKYNHCQYDILHHIAIYLVIYIAWLKMTSFMSDLKTANNTVSFHSKIVGNSVYAVHS